MTKRIHQMVVLSSFAAAVQGMDEAVINGAQIIYPSQFGIGSSSRRSFFECLFLIIPHKMLDQNMMHGSLAS